MVKKDQMVRSNFNFIAFFCIEIWRIAIEKGHLRITTSDRLHCLIIFNIHHIQPVTYCCSKSYFLIDKPFDGFTLPFPKKASTGIITSNLYKIGPINLQ